MDLLKTKNVDGKDYHYNLATYPKDAAQIDQYVELRSEGIAANAYASEIDKKSKFFIVTDSNNKVVAGARFEGYEAGDTKGYLSFKRYELDDYFHQAFPGLHIYNFKRAQMNGYIVSPEERGKDIFNDLVEVSMKYSKDHEYDFVFILANTFGKKYRDTVYKEAAKETGIGYYNYSKENNPVQLLSKGWEATDSKGYRDMIVCSANPDITKLLEELTLQDKHGYRQGEFPAFKDIMHYGNVITAEEKADTKFFDRLNTLPKAVLFPLVGILIDDKNLWRKAYNQAFRAIKDQYNVVSSNDVSDISISCRDKDFMEYATKIYPDSLASAHIDKDILQIRKSFIDIATNYYEKNITQPGAVNIKPEIVTLLATLHEEKIPYAIVSNNDANHVELYRRILQNVLSNEGIRDEEDEIPSFGDSEKPTNKVLPAIMSKLKLEPHDLQNCLMLCEDIKQDFKFGANNGMKCMVVGAKNLACAVEELNTKEAPLYFIKNMGSLIGEIKRAEKEQHVGPRGSALKNAEVHFLEIGNGEKLAYKIYEAQKVTGELPQDYTVLSLSGYMSNMKSEKSKFTYDYCKEKNINFLAFDYQGMGQSSGEIKDMTISKWKDNVITVINKLVKTNKVLMVGSSFSPWIMSLVAKEIPHKIHGMIGIGAIPDSSQILHWNRFNESQQREIMEQGMIKIPSNFIGENALKEFTITKKYIEDGRNNQILGTMINVRCPITLIYNTGDKLASDPELITRFTRVFPNAKVQVLFSEPHQQNDSLLADHRMQSPEDIEVLRKVLDNMTKSGKGTGFLNKFA